MKGMFTQAAALLTRGNIDIDDVTARLSEFGEIRRSPGGTDWAFGTASVMVPLRPEVNGYVVVDYVPRVWPDAMGDPQKEPMIFGAWSMGFFGPFAYPGGLQMARAQCRNWQEGSAVAATHDGFLRFRCSYALGANQNTPVRPQDYDPADELVRLTKIVSRCVMLPNVLCYFNPNGETLYAPDEFIDILQHNEQVGLLSLDLWTNVRLFNLKNQVPGWFLEDTVGLAQLDTPDLEAVYPINRYDAGEVAHFLRNVSVYLTTNDVTIQDGDTVDGPGGVRWQGYHHGEPITKPPRNTIRWFPVDRTKRPAILTQQKSK